MFQWMYETISNNIWVLVLTSFIFLISKFYFRSRFISIHEEVEEKSTKQDNEFEKCQSPSCIRCRSHQDILKRARTRLSYSSQLQKGVEPSSESKLYLDIENSLYKRFRRLENMDQTPSVFKMSGLEARPYWDIEDTPELSSLQFNSNIIDDIRTELISLMKVSDTDVSVQSIWKVNSVPDGMWSICHLVDQGKTTKIVERCPKTWNAILNLSEAAMRNNIFGNVAFSVIVPGTTIAPHYGSTNIRLRSHIGLLVPDRCLLTVNNEEKKYHDGATIIFDDSFSHKVQHLGIKSNGVRAVLMIDMWHPHLTESQRNLLNFVFSPEL